MSRYAVFVEKLRASITTSPGELPPAVRVAILTGDSANIPAVLAPYVTKVVQHAYKVTDDDVQHLRQSGLSEDAIFEATAAAAVGAALFRLEKGMAALRAT